MFKAKDALQVVVHQGYAVQAHKLRRHVVKHADNGRHCALVPEPLMKCEPPLQHQERWVPAAFAPQSASDAARIPRMRLV